MTQTNHSWHEQVRGFQMAVDSHSCVPSSIKSLTKSFSWNCTRVQFLSRVLVLTYVLLRQMMRLFIIFHNLNFARNSRNSIFLTSSKGQRLLLLVVSQLEIQPFRSKYISA